MNVVLVVDELDVELVGFFADVGVAVAEHLDEAGLELL